MNSAAKDPNPYKRLALVGAFCIGGYALNIYRTLKFFNPMLSETYEYIDNDLNFRYYAEQVSHHPAISACYVEGDGFKYYTNTNAESKFLFSKGALEFQPIGRTFVNFSNFNETITFNKPKATVRNLMFGKLHLDSYGTILVTNHNTGDTCKIKIFEEGYPTKNDRGVIVGECRDAYGNIQMKIEGNWESFIEISYKDELSERTIKETIWEKIKIEGNEEDRYFFSDFAINLNNINDELREVLPPTDSRFRPDQRALEEQNMTLAGEEKNRLEEKQRDTRKIREKQGIKYKPMYFEETYDDLTGEVIYLYTGSYWENRYNRDFSKFYNIY